MKLINKFTLWYLCITLTAMLVGFVIAYHKVKSGIDQAEIDRLKVCNDQMAMQMRHGVSPDTYMKGRPVEIKLLEFEIPVNKYDVYEHTFFNTMLQHRECRLTVTSFYNINGHYYSISSYNYITKAKEILKGLFSSFIWIFAILLTLTVLSARFVSRLILAPFHQAMKKVRSFNLKDRRPLQLPAANAAELKTLNCFLNGMADKALDDYRSLKEFTENASHELQTPLAVLRNKLELLTESYLQGKEPDTIVPLIGDMQNAIDKLSRINSSLTLLARLENNEFDTRQSISISQLITDALQSFSELMDMKSITQETMITTGVKVQLHPALTDILLGNLLSNAIRHNVQGGQIRVTLNRSRLVIANTGNPPEVPTNQLFRRFKKGSRNNDSIGIGLAIVKQICDVNHFNIQYDYAEGWHIMQIIFEESTENIKPLKEASSTRFPEKQF
ncbi:sensor histidine kinase [Chitinophaga pinensis]|uniref:histidine kinase n=1 Tax=Chitinophaga pinensis (strain ATCC 43595 / DSM 2588 / LMG 13176 / NBRC 15968 / NCIMB 11800 / UQM 2034) TaxID=485918 RepID=A0A979G3L4_CHIPD|nr:HAMP domain-containing sensor histidine kinase [Chitinophaga pinensis]ACU60068.1 histidine kinase [Chitinophaga pinensis DSM 2588]